MVQDGAIVSVELETRRQERRHKSGPARDEREERGPFQKATLPPSSTAMLRQLFADGRRPSSQATIARHVLALQATHGNQYVQGMVSAATVQRQFPGGILAREPAGGAGKTTFKPVARKTYTISAKTLAKAVAKVEAYQAANGEAGLTQWNPKLSFKLDDDGNVKSAKVTVGISVTLPSWPGAAKVSAAARAEWNRGLGELKTH